MTPHRAVIVGVGQRLAGDDGVGPAVIDRLRAALLPADIVLAEVGEPSALIPWLHDAGGRVVIVDAMLADAPGEVRALDPAALEPGAQSSILHHGVSVGHALALAAATRAPESPPPEVRVVAVGIARPVRGAEGLSPAVAAAVDEAACLALALTSPASAWRERGA